MNDGAMYLRFKVRARLGSVRRLGQVSLRFLSMRIYFSSNNLEWAYYFRSASERKSE